MVGSGWMGLFDKENNDIQRDSLAGVGWSPRSGSATYKLCVLEKVNKPLCAFVFSVKGEFSTTKVV